MTKATSLLAALFCALFSSGARASDGVLLNGAGATLPAPLFTKWFAEYNRLHSDVQINYQAIGSGAGIKQVGEHTVDFGASDSPLSDDDLVKAPDLVHVPAVLGAVAVVVNSGGRTLKLSPEALAGIFLGRITRWSDPSISADNAGLADGPIIVVHRADSSGTTGVFTDWLSRMSPDWKQGVGTSRSPKWPVGVGAKGNEGVVATVKQTPGAIGYAELAYATQGKLEPVELRNREGHWVRPTEESIAAAAAAVEIPRDFRTTLDNARGAASYPIATLTFLLVHQDEPDPVRGKALAEFLWWAVHDGQKYAAPLDYSELPHPLVKRIEATLRTLTASGKPVLAARR